MAENGEKAQLARHEESISPPGLPRSHFSEKDIKPDVQPVKLDKHGYPLVPQPSENPDDPLVDSLLVLLH